MRLSHALKIGLLAGAFGLCIHGQTSPSAAAPVEAKGLPPRAAPTDYQAQAVVGPVTIGAEFTRHSIPTPQGALTTEEYITVEVGFFGAAGTRVKISADDFSLRVNGKKTALPSQPFGLAIASVKDPLWEPPTPPPGAKSKGGITTGGDGDKGDSTPAPVVVPIGVQRANAQRVQKAALPEGDRGLPVAGVLFFQYRGKVQGIHQIELIYASPAGKATFTLEP